MTKSKIRDSIAVLFILSHFFILILVGILYILRGFTFEETTTTIAILAPIFAAYTTLIVRQVLTTPHGTRGVHIEEDRERFLFVFVSFFFPVLFAVILVAIVFLRAYNVGISTFEQFKIMLGIVEGVFATYVGLVINALFTSPLDAAKAKSKATGERT